MLSIGLTLSTAAPGSQPYHWKSVTFGHRTGGSHESVDELVSPREGPHLISGLRYVGGLVHWDLSLPPTGVTTNAKIEDIESLSWAVDCPLLVVCAGRGPLKSGGYTHDGGLTWNDFSAEPTGAGGGSIVFNSTAQVIVWSTGGATSRSFDFGASWSKCEGLVGNSELVADGVTPTRTYALSETELYSSDDTAGSFQPENSVGLPQAHGRMRATEYQVGDLWIPAQAGLFHSVDAGKFFQKLPNVDSAESVGFGKPASGEVYPTVFISGKIDGVVGVFRSDDGGQTWVRISNPALPLEVHGIVAGDPRVYGRVYLGTKDHGILYGDPK